MKRSTIARPLRSRSRARRGRSSRILTLAPLLIAAASPRSQGELILDATAPFIDAVVAGVPLRLRVDLAGQDEVELNPAAARRLPVRWSEDLAIDVGRVRLPGHVSRTAMRVDGMTMPVEVAEHGRDCCRDADGAVGPGLLPYATVRWRRAEAPAANAVRTLALDYAPETGLSAALPDAAPGLRVRFDLTQAETVATAAAGAILARAWGGRWDGPPTRLLAAFGVERPARAIAFAHPGLIVGFQVARLPVRIADFGGREALPQEPGDPVEIVVRGRIRPQRAWPAVTLGADRLARCREIAFTAAPRVLSLACAFDPP